MTLALIDKQDGFEIIRDKIAAILVAEIAQQQILAAAAGKDATLWKVRIYSERSNAWEQWLDDQIDVSPICNIWFDSAAYSESSGNVVSRQTSASLFNLDCYGYGIAKSAVIGHTLGDQEAAATTHRAVRLIRNILMAAENTYLGLRGTVGQRWLQSITVYQPEFQGQAIQQIVGARLALRVSHNELSPQVAAETLEYISVTVKRSPSGEVILTAEYDFS